MAVIQPWYTCELLKDQSSSLVLLTGGLGSGKTHTECIKHLDLCAINSNSPISVFFEPTYPKIFDTAIPTFRKVASDLGYLESVHYKIKPGHPYPRIQLITSGQEIQLRSAENPDSIVGFEASHASCDEVAAWKKASFLNVQSRVRCPKANLWQTVAAGAPQGLTWLAEDYDSDTLPGWEYVNGFNRNAINKKKSVRRLTLWTDENPFIPRAYLRSLQNIYGHNANLIKAYRYGIFCAMVEGCVFAAYLPARHDLEDRDPDPLLEINLTFDFNANPLAWVAIQKHNLGQYGSRHFAYIALHEANEGNTQIDDTVVEFAEKHPPRSFKNTKIRLFGDPTGHHGSHKVTGSDFENIYKALKRLGYTNVEICADKSAPAETASADCLNRLFVDNLLFICKRCTMLRRGLMATTCNKGEKKIEKKAGETHTHHPDSVKYWAWKETREFTKYQLTRSWGTVI